MKKIFFIFVLLSCFAAGFAETGYRGIQWYSNIEAFPKKDQINYEGLLVYEKIILGKKTYLFYALYENQLQLAAYIITKDKTEELKKELKKYKKTEIKADLANGNEYPGKTKIESESWMIGDAYNLVDQIEKVTPEELKAAEDKTASGKITIYDYNEDTRCYVLENFIADRTAVVYVPHEQYF